MRQLRGSHTIAEKNEGGAHGAPPTAWVGTGDREDYRLVIC